MNEVFPNAFRPKARNPARATCKINSVRINFLAMSSEPSTPAIPPELVERMQNQEPAAFEEFLEQYGTNLYYFGVRMCGDRDDAQDMLQDTFLKIFQSIKDLKNPEAFKSWLYRIAARECMMKRRHSRFLKQEIPLDEVIPDPERLRNAAPWARMPDQALLDGELQEVLQRAILDLPPIYRPVLVMRDMQGLTTQEVADALDISADVVKMRLHRARAKVRNALDDFLSSGSR